MSIPTKIFIIPYKNRESQKHHFEIYMKYILEDFPKSDYEIYFSHQTDNRPFNRGAIKNIGFLAMKAKYPNHYKNISFIFNDIDTMPIRKNVLNFNTTSGVVKHYYGFNFALGGIFSITGADFEKSGGFPNFWGWGLEDNCMQNRVLKNGIKIDRSTFYNFLDHNILHINDDLKKIFTKQDIYRVKYNTTDTLNDIKNLNYIIENNFIHIKTFDTKYDFSKDTFYNKHIKEGFGKILPDANYDPKLSNLRKMPFNRR
jgi:hypothetical protein